MNVNVKMPLKPPSILILAKGIQQMANMLSVFIQWKLALRYYLLNWMFFFFFLNDSFPLSSNYKILGVIVTVSDTLSLVSYVQL